MDSNFHYSQDLHQKIDQFHQKLNDFVNKVSEQAEDDELYAALAQEFLSEFDADRVSLLVTAGLGKQMSFVCIHQAYQKFIPEIPLPYLINLEEDDPYHQFLAEAVQNSVLVQRYWSHGVEPHPLLRIHAAAVKSFQISPEETWIFCLQWKENFPLNWGFEQLHLFEDMLRYTGLIVKQQQLVKQSIDLQIQQSSLIDAMPSAIIGLDFLGNITLVNHRAEQIFNVIEEDLIGLNLSHAIPILSDLMKHTLEVLEKGEVDIEPIVYADDDLNIHYLKPFFFNLLGEDRGEIALRLDDVTQKMALQSQLLHAQKMETVGLLAGGLAHDFNNILGGIVGTISLLEERWKSQDLKSRKEDFEDLGLIQECTTRATEIVHRLLDLSRPSDGTWQKINLKEIVKNALKLAKGSFGRQVQIRSEFKIKEAWIMGEQSRIENAILNLCLNARDAMPNDAGRYGHGQIMIEVGVFDVDHEFRNRNAYWGDSEQFYYVEVADNGVGMPKDVVDKIFEAFFTTKGQGTGLGLLIVDKMIRKHKGLILCESQVGVGTVFKLYFPVISAVAQEQIPPSLPMALVVEDDKILRKISEKMLENLGFKVIAVEDGPSAVNALHSESRFDLLLMDVDLPGMNGIDTVKLIRKLVPEQKVVFTTSHSEQYDYNFENLPLQTLMEKPFTMDDFSFKINQLLKK